MIEYFKLENGTRVIKTKIYVPEKIRDKLINEETQTIDGRWIVTRDYISKHLTLDEIYKFGPISELCVELVFEEIIITQLCLKEPRKIVTRRSEALRVLKEGYLIKVIVSEENLNTSGVEKFCDIPENLALQRLSQEITEFSIYVPDTDGRMLMYKILINSLQNYYGNHL